MGSYKWGISRVTILITHFRGLVTLLITTHEPPSSCNYSSNLLSGLRASGSAPILGFYGFGCRGLGLGV